jgi:hypothetical protein
VVDLLLGETAGTPAREPLSPADAQVRAGVYRHAGSGEVVQVTAENGALRVGFEGGALTPLHPLGDERYRFGEDETTTYAFVAPGVTLQRRQPNDGGAPLVLTFAGRCCRSKPVRWAFPARTDVTRVRPTMTAPAPPKFPDLPVRPLTRDLLVAESARVYGTLRFDVARDTSGVVSGFRLGTARLRGLRFRRAG